MMYHMNSPRDGRFLLPSGLFGWGSSYTALAPRAASWPWVDSTPPPGNLSSRFGKKFSVTRPRSRFRAVSGAPARRASR